MLKGMVTIRWLLPLMPIAGLGCLSLIRRHPNIYALILFGLAASPPLWLVLLVLGHIYGHALWDAPLVATMLISIGTSLVTRLILRSSAKELDARFSPQGASTLRYPLTFIFGLAALAIVVAAYYSAPEFGYRFALAIAITFGVVLVAVFLFERSNRIRVNSEPSDNQ